MHELLAISVTLPMLFSVASFGWSRLFGDPDLFPGSARLHILLILLQVLSVTMVYGYPSQLSFLGISFLYFVQGMGVAYFMWQKGRVDCGCLGPQINSKLGFPLIVFNLLMGLMGLAYSHPVWFAHSTSFTVTGVLLEGMLLMVALFIIVGVPDALYAIRVYRELAAPYVSKIKRL